jgi:hypothetical protein
VIKELKTIATFCLPYETIKDKENVLKEIHSKYDKEGNSFVLKKYYNDLFSCNMVEVDVFSD